jgi:hypothetical protein
VPIPECRTSAGHKGLRYAAWGAGEGQVRCHSLSTYRSPKHISPQQGDPLGGTRLSVTPAVDRDRIRRLQERNRRRAEETRETVERANLERARIRRSLENSDLAARRARRTLRRAGLLKDDRGR